jgi:ABC-type nitrate/sulfonate/bicarbonate transport system substrate-binding protein
MNKQTTHTLKGLSWMLLTLLLISAGCSREEPAQPAQAAKPGPEPVRLGVALQPQSALALIARDKGYFKTHGLNVEFHEFPSGKRALNEGLFTGKVDLVTASDLPVAMAALNEKAFTILATIFNANNINRVIARRDAGITAPSELRGMRVATQKASAVHYFLHLFMLEYGLSEESLQLSFMKAEQLPPALAEGKIDAFSMREPYISEAKDLLGDNAITFAAPGIYSQVDIAVITPTLLNERPAAVTAILAALLDAENLAQQQPAEAMKIVATALGSPLENIEQIWPSLKLQLRLEQALLMLLESESRWAIRHGYTTAQEVPDFMQHIKYTPLKKLSPDAVTLIH